MSGLELRPGGGLVDRAVKVLGDGPLPTSVVADRVMGLRGNERAAAAAVFALLGTDTRFRVDGSGVWRLVAPPAPEPCVLRDEDWVVVDVETTGGSPHRGDRVTEVGVVWVSRGEIRDTYCTLVNPERRIPAMIVSLTGITDEMVRDAPRFRDVASRVAEALRGRVFVAHNASFDWRFLSAELDRALGMRLTGRQLCTVKLARKLLPELPSRSLDALALYFGLSIESRHRALDDAVATARLLLRLCDLLEEQEVRDWASLQALLARRPPRQKRIRLPRSMDSA